MEKSMRRTMSRSLIPAAALVAALAIVSCSGVPKSPAQAIRKMVHAHGGRKNVSRVQTFVARGFIKDLSDNVVVESFAFDMYRKGEFYKHVITRAPRGTVTQVIVMYYDGKNNYQWINGKGLREVAPMEVGVLRYRFPMVLEWLRSSGLTGELLPYNKKEGLVELRYKDGNDVVTVMLDGKSGLLSGVEVRDLADSTFMYREVYEEYFDLGDIRFPSRFKATLKNLPYYEFLVPTVELKTDIPDSLFRVTAEDTAAFVKPVETKEPQRK
jgi:hypothetical protein